MSLLVLRQISPLLYRKQFQRSLINNSFHKQKNNCIERICQEICPFYTRITQLVLWQSMVLACSLDLQFSFVRCIWAGCLGELEIVLDEFFMATFSMRLRLANAWIFWLDAHSLENACYPVLEEIQTFLQMITLELEFHGGNIELGNSSMKPS